LVFNAKVRSKLDDHRIFVAACLQAILPIIQGFSGLAAIRTGQGDRDSAGPTLNACPNSDRPDPVFPRF
jgi:hypothetical protein